MNRRQRRDRDRRDRQPAPAPPGLRAAAACPDCDSDVTVTEVAPGAYEGQVAHDPTCLWMANLKAHGGQAVRFFP